MSLEILTSAQFRKDIKLAKKRGLNLKKLEILVDLLAEGAALSPGYRDHPLSGKYSAFRECHISPDWLLIYRIDNDILALFLFRTGSHSDLF